jgi:hypothetical protein
MHIQTLKWVNDELDKVNKESEQIGEMLMEATDPKIVKLLDNKLAELENKIAYLFSKIEIEKRNNK